MAIQRLLHLLKKMAKPINGFIKKLRESDDSDLSDLHHMLWAIENYGITVNILNGVVMTIIALFIAAVKPADLLSEIVVASLPISFSLLLVGLIIRRFSVRISFSLQIAGILLSIFQFFAYSFDDRNLGFKVITILSGIACFILLGMPLWALFSNGRTPQRVCHALVCTPPETSHKAAEHLSQTPTGGD